VLLNYIVRTTFIFDSQILLSVPPHINRNDLPNVSVKIGQPIKYNVNIIGEPPPEVTWELAGKMVRSTDRIKIENPDYKSHFNIAKATRKDSGKYKVTAKNVNGVDVAEVDILVLGELLLLLSFKEASWGRNDLYPFRQTQCTWGSDGYSRCLRRSNDS